MKRILPILTLALLAAAATASASNYYYDYYQNPADSGVTPNTATIGGGSNERDSFTYGTWDNVEGDNGSNDFTVKRELNWTGSFKWAGANNNFFYIQVGENNKEKTTLYLTDFVRSVVPQSTYPFNSDSNALFNMGIDEVGYRVLTSNSDGTYSASTSTPTDSFKLLETDETGNVQLSGRVTAADTVAYTPGKEDVVTRYKYELGTFNPGDIVELYMKDTSGREVYSFSSFEGEDDGFVPFDNTNSNTNTATAQGGFGDGGYRAAQIQTDAMLQNYYFVEELTNNIGETVDNPDKKDYKIFLADYIDEDGNLLLGEDAAIKLAAQRAQPLSQLIPGNFANAAVAFGIYAMASGIAPDDGSGTDGTGTGGFGQPLPGGLQLAMIAGLFGLGFCYVRRRKAIAG